MTEIRVDAIELYLWELWDRKGTDILLTAGVPPPPRGAPRRSCGWTA